MSKVRKLIKITNDRPDDWKEKIIKLGDNLTNIELNDNIIVEEIVVDKDANEIIIEYKEI